MVLTPKLQVTITQREYHLSQSEKWNWGKAEREATRKFAPPLLLNVMIRQTAI
jgi:fatty acid desaturase